MKWLGRILYVILVIMVGSFVIRIANINKQISYYTEHAVPYLKENNKDKYMEEFMTANLVDKYLKKPVYKAISTDSELPMDLSIYHLVANEDTTYLMFYFDDRMVGSSNDGISYPIRNINQYDENNELVKLGVNIYLHNNDLNEPLLKTNEFYSFKLDERMPAALLQVLEVTNEDTNTKEKVFAFNWINEDGKTVMKQATDIAKIEVVLIDQTYEEDATGDDLKVKESLLLEINHTDNYDNETSANLLKDNDIMKTSDFNGNIASFDLISKYEESSLVNVIDLTKLDPYQKIVTKTLVIFSIVLIAITYLIFFLKPTINYFKDKKALANQQGSNNIVDADGKEVEEITPIFKDDIEE